MKNKKQASKIKKFFLGGLVLICGIAVLGFVFKEEEKSLPHRNLMDMKISQYSDKHITSNAVAINPEFKSISFGTSLPEKSSFFSNQMAAVVRAVKSFTTTKNSETKEYGSWVWTPVMQMTPEYMESIISGAKKDGVNTIYVSVDTYLDIFVMPKGPERERQKRVFSKKLEDFIVRANRRGISVDAEAGWRNWAENDNIYKAFAVVNYVKNFNATHKNKFRGFQYDVEPYLLDSYKENPASVLKNFVRLVDQTEYFIGADNLKFSVVVPDFYDEKDGITPKFLYNGSKESAFKHLLNILERRQSSSIIVMSYRNFADGEDGSIEVSNNEIRTANRGYKTKVIIAQETGDVPPPYITFHNLSKKYFSKQTEKINTAFNSYPNFGGIAVHYVNAFLALK